MNKPLIVLTSGDPNGIGPEIAVKALVNDEVFECCNTIIVGDESVIRNAIKITGVGSKINIVKKPKDGKFEKNTINLIDVHTPGLGKLRIGTVQAIAGEAASNYISKAIQLALDKEVDVVTTGPINKESFHAANVPYIGHTEMLAELTNTENPLTMFEVRGLRVFFLSRHHSLRKACDLVTKEAVEKFIKECDEALKKFGVLEGTMAVAGLNPHCGEHGLFGDEEVIHIEPAVKNMQKKGYKVVGPIGADSVFHQALQGKYSAVLSLYHDQGHIATKTLDFEKTISITIGLPFLRTSVDHGTALDIAGKNLASEISTIEALKLAAKYGKFYNI